MSPEPSTTLDLTRPRSVAEILATALRLYGREPVLFILLALAVVGPYDLIILAVANASPLGQQSVSAGTVTVLALVDFALVGPLVSAFQMQALVTIGAGGRPAIGDVVARGLRVLPVVAAAEIIAGLGIGLGLVLFIIPGVILALRWAVVAQVAAIEETNWPGALRRSAALSAGNYLRIFGLLALVSLINLTLTSVAGQLAGTGTRPAQVALGIAVGTLTRSFEALAIAVLYFDLRARLQ